MQAGGEGGVVSSRLLRDSLGTSCPHESPTELPLRASLDPVRAPAGQSLLPNGTQGLPR